jgi:hypothetical protein
MLLEQARDGIGCGSDVEPAQGSGAVGAVLEVFREHMFEEPCPWFARGPTLLSPGVAAGVVMGGDAEQLELLWAVRLDAAVRRWRLGDDLGAARCMCEDKTPW